MPVEWLFRWWNAVYTVPLAFVLVFLTITSCVSLVGGALGELGQGDADAHVEHDLDVDHDVDLHADADHDVDVDHDVDLDHDADLDHDGNVSSVERAVHVSRGGSAAAEHGIFVSVLVALGVGRAPLVMLLQVLVLLWGLIGISLHQAVGARGPGVLLWSVPLSILMSVFGTRAFATTLGRFFKHKETYAVRRDQLVGRTGRVVFPVTAEEGTVHVLDQHGTLQRLRARSTHGRLESGQQIIVIGFDPDRKVYEVDDSARFVERA